MTALKVRYLFVACPALVLVGVLTARTPENEKQAPRTVRVAGIVLKWVRGDKEANYRRAEPMIREAAGTGPRSSARRSASSTATPSPTRRIPLEEYRALGEPIPDGPYYRRLAALADGAARSTSSPGMTEADGDARYNTAVLIGPDGKLIGKYRKQQLGHESVRNTAGDESRCSRPPYGRSAS